MDEPIIENREEQEIKQITQEILPCADCKWLRSFECDLGHVDVCFNKTCRYVVEDKTDNSTPCKVFEKK